MVVSECCIVHDVSLLHGGECCIVHDVQLLQNKPNYLILVDTRDRPKQLTTYVAEENLDVLHRTVVSLMSCSHMFHVMWSRILFD